MLLGWFKSNRGCLVECYVIFVMFPRLDNVINFVWILRIMSYASKYSELQLAERNFCLKSPQTPPNPPSSVHGVVRALSWERQLVALLTPVNFSYLTTYNRLDLNLQRRWLRYTNHRARLSDSWPLNATSGDSRSDVSHCRIKSMPNNYRSKQMKWCNSDRSLANFPTDKFGPMSSIISQSEVA